MNYRFAPHVVLIEQDDGGILWRQTPLTVLRVNRSLTALLKQVEEDVPIAESAANKVLFNQLVARGFLDQLPAVPAELALYPLVSVIIPVRDRAEELGRCLSSLTQLHYPAERLEVIVVDDGSSDNSIDVARNWGGAVILSGGDGVGPAAARNRGAASAKGEILAFIDSDCTASKEWLNELVPPFTDSTIAAVGGMVAGMFDSSPLDRYEAVMSSLSLGGHRRVAGKGEDTFYLPSCNLLVKSDIFLEMGGFRPTMQVGEDVDLSWRIRDKGWRIAYLPLGKIFHEHRNRLRSFVSRRFFYGTSEEKLQRLHPLRRKQMAVPPLLAGLLFVCLTIPVTGVSGVLLAAAMLMADSMAIRQKTKKLGVQLGLFQLMKARLRTVMSLMYYISFHLVRYHLILLLVLSLWLPMLIPLTILMLSCSVLVDFSVKKPKMSLIQFFFIYLFEQIAYGLGVFGGCLKGKNFLSYFVVVRSHLDEFA